MKYYRVASESNRNRLVMSRTQGDHSAIFYSRQQRLRKRQPNQLKHTRRATVKIQNKSTMESYVWKESGAMNIFKIKKLKVTE